MRYHYSRTCRIRAPIQLLYDFHLFTPNAKLIQPWGMSVREVEMPPEIKEGAEVGLHVSVFGLPQHWRVVWDELTPPHVPDDHIEDDDQSASGEDEKTGSKGEAPASDSLNSFHKQYRVATMADRAIQSPFPYFKQTRTFRERPGAGGGITEMTDAIEYEPPFPWLGWISRLTQPLLQEHLSYMFYVRQRLTKRILEATAHPVDTLPDDPADAATANAVRIRSEAEAREQPEA